MRELIYVSTAKLRQLVPDLPKRPRGLRDVEAEVTTPVGGVKVGKAARPAEPGLAAAVAGLEASPRAPKWFAEPGLRPGQWVHFEAPMAYGEIGGSVVFLDVDEAVDGYPTGGRLRLLLHGSRDHLVGALPGAERDMDPGHHSLWVRFVQILMELDEPDRAEAAEHPRFLARMVDSLDALADRLQPRFTAAWAAGYARITAVVPVDECTILAATPLYVEHVAPPD
ncbi:SAVMC3_10250 family protein [Amycolatopsis thermophila]|uniref:Uncharacterized protein n=1 Tax=Amycolatopsis thermophila TaxID=206084 RepID=A0ABU0EUI7_9PSEU|nr:SAVMC3_10250 family protein [Amycolatopsis thermophila]MDQ0378457.1 hypothetical protein [Amycolatopsis thermophila]